MYKKSMFGIIIICLIVLSLLIPSTNATSVSVTLNPKANDATVNAYVNTTMKMTINGSKFMVDDMEHVMGGTFSNMTKMHFNNSRMNATTVNDFNNSIAPSTHGASVRNVSMSFNVKFTNASTSDTAVFYVNYSMYMHLVLYGIFNNSSANMSWRNFSMSKPLSVNGTNVNQVGNNKTASASAINFSKFSRPLSQWTRTYSSSSNVTTFVYNAGVVLSLNNETTMSPHPGVGGMNMTMNLTIDPAYAISMPGNATAGTNTITVSSASSTGSSTTPTTPPVNTYYYLIAVVLIVGVAATVYVVRRRH